jgi:predicted naringenin-chalcone synthase
LTAPLNIVAVRTLLPEHRVESAEVEPAFMRWLADRPEAERYRARKILRNCGVETRHSALSLEEIFTPCSLTESSRRYRHHAVRLGVKLLRETLAAAGIKPSELDILITTSCTGFMIPSIDAHMANELGMRPDLIRLPVTQMGCAAGASALMYAAEMLKSRPGGVAAIVTVELPTNTVQLHDFSADNIVSSALFADGLACTIIRNGGAPDGSPSLATIDGWSTHQVPNTLGLIGYQLTTGGFLMNLDPALPDVIAEQFDAATRPILERHGVALADIQHFLVHPGGLKILDRIEEILARHGRDARFSRETMRDCGNMSSSTVLFILERLLASSPAPGKALLMSFGPGFGAHQVMLSVGPGSSPSPSSSSRAGANRSATGHA